MFLSSSQPCCKLEISFCNVKELREFHEVMSMVNSLSKYDYSRIVQELGWMLNDSKRFACINVDDSDFLPFSNDDEEV